MAEPAVPGGMDALPDGAHALFEICRGGRGRLPVDAPLHPQGEHGGAGRLHVCLFRLHSVQRVLQPLCGCGGAVPLSALGAGRGGVRKAPGPLRGAGGAEPAQQLLLLRRSGGVPGHLFCVHGAGRAVQNQWPHLRCAGLRKPGRRGHGRHSGHSHHAQPAEQSPGIQLFRGLRPAALQQCTAVCRHSLQLLLPAGLPLYAGDLRFRRH